MTKNVSSAVGIAAVVCVRPSGVGNVFYNTTVVLLHSHTVTS